MRTFSTYLLFKKLFRTKLAVLGFLLILSASVYSQNIIEIGGEIESQEWVGDNVYHITSDIIIRPGIQLVIRQGVQVKFRQGTGMTVNGSLKVYGYENGTVDSVLFVPLYTSPGSTWKWKGIQFGRAQAPNTNMLDYVKIENAIIGIQISDEASNISITNTSILYSQLFGVYTNFTSNLLLDNCRIQHTAGRGLSLQNSSNCVVSNSFISDNYEGVQIIASGANTQSSGNLIENNVIRRSGNVNLLINNDAGGICTGNTIMNNYLEQSFTAILIGSPSYVGGKNHVIGNVIVTRKDTGNGLVIHQDTTTIKHNIFWQNKNAIELFRTGNVEISNNSFYDNGFLNNGVCVIVNPGATKTGIFNNTFTGNGNILLELKEASGTEVHYNNFFKNRRVNDLLDNTTSGNIPAFNNYWGVNDEGLINNMISGNFTITPFLLTPDTVAPVSPPQPAYKQQVGNSVRVSWQANPESDLSGYRIHYGDFSYYTFEDNVDAGADTTILLDFVSITDAIAVTAYDNDFLRGGQQTLGHESPFSFPVIIPYAGPDTSICKDQTSFYITESTYSGSLINMSWSTSGDGSFGNHNQLSTIYYPGHADFDSGQVVLTLFIVADIGLTFQDSFVLTFLDFPEAFAGNDTLLVADSSLHLIHAYAMHYDSVFWTSTGDGTFSDAGVVNPVYTPGETDVVNGETQLILHVSSVCGIATDTINVSIERRYRLEGRVWHDGMLLSQGSVLAVRLSEHNVKTVAHAIVVENGSFKFTNLAIGNYLICAIADTLFYPNTLPGYYVNKNYWQDAYLLNLYANTFDLDIILKSQVYSLPAGAGSISGHFMIPEDFTPDKEYCYHWFGAYAGEFDNCRGGLSNITILLYNGSGSKLLKHTFTGETGHFYFPDLPFGEYIVSAEKPGYNTIPSPLLSLNPQNPDIDDLLITIEPFTIKVAGSQKVSKPVKIEVFPNPAKTSIKLPFDPSTEPPQLIEIRNIMGQLLVRTEPYQASGLLQGYHVVNIEGLQAGIYFGTLTTASTVRTFTFVKE